MRNELNRHAPITAFVRIKMGPSGGEALTPREVAARTSVVTLSARRDPARAWIYGIRISFLR